MKYFTARIRARTVYLGYNADGEKIKVDLNRSEYIEKVIKLDRILSFAEDHIFVACPHDTVEVWDYEGDLSMVKEYLKAQGLLVA